MRQFCGAVPAPISGQALGTLPRVWCLRIRVERGSGSWLVPELDDSEDAAALQPPRLGSFAEMAAGVS